MHLLSVASLANRALVALVTLCIAVFGGVALSSLKTELTPELSLPAVVVTVQYEGATPEIVNSDVTVPVERAVQSVQGLESTTGTSMTGVSTVLAEFAYGVNLATTEQRVQQAVNRIQGQLPEGVETSVLTGSISDLPIVRIAVSGAGDDAALVDRVETVAVPQLERIDGVRAAELRGAPGQRVTVAPDDAVLAAAGLTREDIRTAVDEHGQLLPGGTVDDGDETLSVQIGDRLESAEDIAALPLRSEAADAGTPPSTEDVVTIGDVASVTLEQDPVSSVALVNGERSILLSVTKTQAANTVDVSRLVLAALPQLEEELGSDVTLTVVQNQAPYIEQSIEALGTEGLLGLGFAVLVILVFLLSVRSTIVTAISIPASVLMTFIGMWGAQYSLNIITLGALTISIGRVVDDSIVVIENIKRHLAFQPSRARAILDAVREVAGAITASTVTTVIVFLPLAFVSDITGELFRPFAITVTIALLSSLLVALTIVPVLAFWLLRSKAAPAAAEEVPAATAEPAVEPGVAGGRQRAPRGRGLVARLLGRRRHGAHGVSTDRATSSDRIETAMRSDRPDLPQHAERPSPATSADEADRPDRLRRAYRPMLAATLRHPVLVLVAAVAVLGASVAAAPLMAFNFLGDDGQTSVTVQQELEPAASLDRQLEAAESFSADLQALADVETVSATVASSASSLAAFTGGGGTDVTYSVLAEPGTDMVDLRDRIRAVADDADGDVVVGQSSGLGSNDIEISVTAPTPAVLDSATTAVVDAMRGLEGVAQTTDSLEAAQPLVQVAVDRDLAASLGLSEAAVSGLLAQAMQPTPLGELQLDGSLVRIWMDAAAPAQSLEALRELELPTPQGPLPLDEVADVSIEEGPVAISTLDGERTATVTVTPADVNTGAVGAAVREALDGLALEDGAQAEIGGVATQMTDALTQLGIAALIAILLVYVVMVATFKSLLQPFLLLVSVPFAATGAIAMQLLTGVPIGVASMVGVLMLVGIVVTNAIVLIDLVNQYRDRGMSVRDALLEGGERRLRPILMTAAATIFALLPMAMGVTGHGGFISQPLAIVVIGGLVSSTLLTLVVLPVLYLVVEGAIERRRQRRGSGTRAERRAELRAAS